jgi:hypothetical protein
MAHVQMPKQGDVKRRNSFNGDNFNSLGQLCITAFYDHWNDYMRREYVIAKGKLNPSETNEEVREAAMREYARFSVWGDLRQIRQAIVHHRGIATKNTERCELFRWFKRKEQILLPPERMRDIFGELLNFRNVIDKEQYPECYIQFEVGS